MANRDHDDSQYDRSEGRIENRDEQSYRDQSNRGSREWDRRGDDFRRDASSGRDRSYASDYQNRDQYQQRSNDYGQSRSSSGSYTGSYGNDYGGSYGSSNYGDRDGQRLGQQEWNRSVGSYRQGGQNYGGQDYARQGAARQDYGRGGEWDNRSQLGSYSPSWQSSAQPSGYRTPLRSDTLNDWGPSYQGENPLRSQEHNRQEWNRTLGTGNSARPSYGQPNYGQSSYGREEEGWGEQIRHAGQQVVNRVKRAFRGPKGYKRSDERIREDVNDRLAQQFDFDPSDVEVQVSGGEVTLTGTVQSRHEKFIAEEIADDVSGVSEVHNQLRVRREDLTSTSATSSGTTTTASSTLVEGQKNRNSPRA